MSRRHDSAGTPFGKWLRQHRKALDLTQEQVAQGVGCSSKTIEKLEGGSRRPSRQVAELLAAFFSIPIEEEAAFVRFARSQASGTSAGRSTESYLPASSGTESSVGSRDIHGAQSITSSSARRSDQGGALADAANLAPWREAVSQESNLPVPPGNLPASPNAFIGRQQEKDRGRFYLRRPGVRLLTLTGPPGIGKSRLALELAASLIGDFEGGAYLVRLASLNDPDILALAIAGALGVSESSREPLLSTVIRSLQGKKTLVLFDNFEHLLPATTVVAELLSSCPLLKLLVTSRQPTHIYGEHELQVPPLSVPPSSIKPGETAQTDEHVRSRASSSASLEEVRALLAYESIQLFTERALAVTPDFSVTPDNARLVTEVCARLEGIPLAIELAAAMTKSLPLPALLDRLSGSIIDLSARTTGVLERQQSIRRAIDWSYRLLEPDEKTLFRRVSVFAGTFDLRSASALIPGADPSLDSEQTLRTEEEGFKGERNYVGMVDWSSPGGADVVQETLEALVDKSLVQAHIDDSGYARYRLLGAIKEYGLEQLTASGESELVQKRYAWYFLEMAEASEDGLRGPEQRRWLAHMDAEHANLRAVLDWFCSGGPGQAQQAAQMAGVMQRFWFMRNHYSEAIQQLTRALSLPGLHHGDLYEARACLALGFFLVERGDVTEACALYERALGIYRERDEPDGVANALHRLGAVANIQGDYPKARELFQESLRLYEQLGDKWRSAILLIALGRLAQHWGEYSESRDLQATSLSIFRELGDKRQVAATLTGLSMVMLELGEAEQARSMLQEALDISSGLAQASMTVSVLTSLGELERYSGNYLGAYSYYERALSIAQKQGNKIRMVPPLHGMAYSTLRLAISTKGGADASVPTLGKARALFETALRTVIEAEYMHHVPTSLAGLADLLAHEGDLEGSATLIGLAERQLEDYGVRLEIPDHSAYKELLDLMRARLGSERFLQARERGREMPLEAVLQQLLRV